MNRARQQSGRDIAFAVMKDVRERDAYANLALASRLRESTLSEQDAAFVTELVAGTLRGQGTYDRIIELAAKRETRRIDPPVLDVLRLATHQLLGMRTASHAAVFESVELVRACVGARATGFVNGVLRTITRTSGEDWLQRARDLANTDVERLAVTHSHPEWIVSALAAALRLESREAELESLLRANNSSPKVQLALLNEPQHEGGFEALRLNHSGVSPLGAQLESGRPGPVIEALKQSGVNARVQDQGSQLAALALTRVSEITSGERWLDLCAGPGGKTAVLAAEAEQADVTVPVSLRANEVSQHRANLVRDSVRGYDVEVVTHDGRDDAAYADHAYDRILIDAPCTGLGALKRRPEARWRKNEHDLTELTRLQRELLAKATMKLAPGGIIAYVTCSPHPAETSEIVRSHLAAHPELTQLDARDVLNKIAREPLDLGDRGDLTAQLWPHRNDTDAMFVALMQRR